MFHKEGHKIIIVSFLLSAIFTILIENFITTYNIKITLQTFVLLFFILLVVSKTTKIKGIVSSCFLIFYGSIRFIIEFYRQPDSHIGYVAFDSISMGQILCLPMIVIGMLIFIYSRKNA